MTPATEQAIDRVRAVCSALPEAAERGGVASGVGKRSGTRVVTFSVSRRIFARLFVLDSADGGEQVVLWVRADPEERASLLEVGHPYFPAGPRELGIVLDADTDWSEIPELVTESYVVMAPAALGRSILE